MTVPPELPPGTLRCSVFLVGIDRGEAAIPFSSDVVCDPRIHVSESGDEPRMFLVIPARGQHCALVLVVHLGIRLIDAAGQFENVPRNVPPTFGTRTFLTRHYNFFFMELETFFRFTATSKRSNVEGIAIVRKFKYKLNKLVVAS